MGGYGSTYGEAVGNEHCTYCTGVDYINNKIYVANLYSNTVSVIDGNNDSVIKTIKVGQGPTFVLVDTMPGQEACCKIYVANFDSSSVSVIAGNNDTVIKTIQLRFEDPPSFIVAPSSSDFYVGGRS